MLTTASGPWGFTCNCPLCRAEQADGSAVRDQRRRLLTFARAFMKPPKAEEPKRTAAQYEDFRIKFENLQATWNDRRYADLPRTDFVEFPTAMMESSWLDHRSDDEETLARIEQLGEALGWDIELSVNSIRLEQKKHALIDRRLTSGLLIAAKLLEANGGSSVAQNLVKKAGVLYKIENGVMAGFEMFRTMIDQGEEVRAEIAERRANGGTGCVVS